MALHCMGIFLRKEGGWKVQKAPGISFSSFFRDRV